MLKTVSSVANAIGALNYKGTWNASTNVPTLVSSVGTKGDYYVVSVAGSTNLNGITDWQINDWAIFNGSAWEKIDNTDLVTSVNGQTGAVVLGSMSNQDANNVVITGGTANVTLGFLNGTASSATMNTSILLAPAGYINVSLANATIVKIPYFAA